jgi:cytochrome c oxidase assembly protein subunit 16
MPGPFSSKSFNATLPNSIAARYRKALQKHPFALFGLPFLATIVIGSFMLTPATALRYERYDRKNQQVTQEEAMGLGQNRRKVNMKDEYYVSGTPGHTWWSPASRRVTDHCTEAPSKGPRELGTATSQAPARRAGRYSCINVFNDEHHSESVSIGTALRANSHLLRSYDVLYFIAFGASIIR